MSLLSDVPVEVLSTCIEFLIGRKRREGTLPIMLDLRRSGACFRDAVADWCLNHCTRLSPDGSLEVHGLLSTNGLLRLAVVSIADEVVGVSITEPPSIKSSFLSPEARHSFFLFLAARMPQLERLSYSGGPVDTGGEQPRAPESFWKFLSCPLKSVALHNVSLRNMPKIEGPADAPAFTPYLVSLTIVRCNINTDLVSRWIGVMGAVTELKLSRNFREWKLGGITKLVQTNVDSLMQRAATPLSSVSVTQEENGSLAEFFARQALNLRRVHLACPAKPCEQCAAALVQQNATQLQSLSFTASTCTQETLMQLLTTNPALQELRLAGTLSTEVLQVAAATTRYLRAIDIRYASIASVEETGAALLQLLAACGPNIQALALPRSLADGSFLSLLAQLPGVELHRLELRHIHFQRHNQEEAIAEFKKSAVGMLATVTVVGRLDDDEDGESRDESGVFAAQESVTLEDDAASDSSDVEYSEDTPAMKRPDAEGAAQLAAHLAALLSDVDPDVFYGKSAKRMMRRYS